MAVMEKNFEANLNEVAREMSRNTVWNVPVEEIVKITKDSPKKAVYAAHMGNLTIVCKAYSDGTFIVKCIRW